MYMDIDKVMEKLRAMANRFGLPMGDRKMTYNSRLAQELGLWAESRGKGYAFHENAFRVYFVDGKNLTEKAVLLDMARAVGLDPEEAESVLDQRLFKSAVDQDWELSMAKGVTAVPTFFMGQDRLVGAQSYEILENLVKKHTQA